MTTFGQSALQQEIVLQQLVKQIRGAEDQAQRIALSDSLMTGLRSMFKEAEAFDHPFSELELAHVQPADKRFRIFTWNVPLNNDEHQYHGLLVLRQGKRLLIHELADATREIKDPGSVQLTPRRWYGALYYDVVMTKRAGKTYYTLLGWKGKNSAVTEKVIEPLNLRGTRVVFGAPLFVDMQEHVLSRCVFGHAADATMNLKKEITEKRTRIVFDHLSPTRPDLEGVPAYYGPDMRVDAYQWEGSKWWLVEDIDARDMRKDKRPYNTPPNEGK